MPDATDDDPEGASYFMTPKYPPKPMTVQEIVDEIKKMVLEQIFNGGTMTDLRTFAEPRPRTNDIVEIYNYRGRPNREARLLLKLGGKEPTIMIVQWMDTKDVEALIGDNYGMATVRLVDD